MIKDALNFRRTHLICSRIPAEPGFPGCEWIATKRSLSRLIAQVDLDSVGFMPGLVTGLSILQAEENLRFGSKEPPLGGFADNKPAGIIFSRLIL